MPPKELELAFYISQTLAIESGYLLRENWQRKKEEIKKDKIDLVTDSDFEIEKHIVNVLSREYPEHGFILEEEDDINVNAKYKWVIDPIDGTKYFAGMVPLFTVSIGLLEEDVPILGVIYNPISHQVYSSYRGLSGIYKNYDLITKDNVVINREPIASIDESKLNTLNQTELIAVKNKYLKLANSYYRVRSFGQGSFSLVLLCLGAVDVFVDLTGYTKQMDIIGGLSILSSFGGFYEYLDFGFGRKHVVAARDKKEIEKIKELFLK